MFFLAYNILSVFLLVPVILYHLYRSVSRGRKPAFIERFGYLCRADRERIAGRPVIWLHAVSVGETIAAKPLLSALRSKYPGHAILISNTTETGRSISSKLPEQDLCIYFPFDFLPAVTLSLDSIKPKLVIIMETEIWPNFTREATRRNIPVILANGRISDRSYARYLKFNWFFRHALQLFSRLSMQTETDCERIVAIGAPQEKTLVTGNLKYDVPFHAVHEQERITLREQYKIPTDLNIITAASTHPGEEEYIIAAYRKLLTASNNLFLVLVPRHPERTNEVATLLEKENIRYRKRASIMLSENNFVSGEVLLVDTVGEMMKLYALADLAFVGGSLVQTGGHNLLEPASLGIPSVFGPNMTNFREIAELVLHYGAGIQLETPDALTEVLKTLIESDTLRQVLGQNGLKMIRDSGGATDHNMQEIARYL